MKCSPTQNEFLLFLREKLLKEKKPFFFLITGEAGTGKTTIAHKLHKESNQIAYLFDTHSIKNIITYPKSNDIKAFVVRNGKKGGLGENILVSILLSISVIIVFGQLYNFCAKTFSLFVLRKDNKKNIRNLYDDDKQCDFYITLKRLLQIRKLNQKFKKYSYKAIGKKYDEKKLDNIIIFDEVNFYDDNSLKYIKDLCFDRRLKKAAPIFCELGVIVNYCTSYYTSPYLSNIIELCNINNKFNLKAYSDEDINFLLSDYNHEVKTIIKSSLKRINNLSLSSNLALVIYIIKYIAQQKKINGFKIDQSNNSHQELMNKYYLNERELKETLELLSLTPGSTFVQEIIELSRLMINSDIDDMAVKNNLYKASKKKFISPQELNLDINKERISFIEPQFLNYFKPKDEFFIKKFYYNYAKVLKIISPGDYSTRSYYHNLCGDNEKSELFQFMSFAQDCYIDSIGDMENIRFNKYKKFANYLREAYSAYYSDNFKKLPALIDKMNLCDVDDIARFEQDWLQCKSILVSADRYRLYEIKNTMTNYLNLIDENEKEILVRVKLILLIIEYYDSNSSAVKKLYSDVISYSQELSRVNGKYDYHKYSVQRKAIIANEIEIAHKETEQSVAYFAQKTRSGNSVFFKREYFYSLINLSATFRAQSNYKCAYLEAEKALKLYEENPNIFPCITLYNAVAVSGFESSSLCLATVLDNYLEPISKHINIYTSTESTDYFILNNIACIMAYSDIVKAYGYIEKAIKILNNCKKSIDGHKHNLYTNKSVLLFLMGNQQQALKVLESVRGVRNGETFKLARHNTLEQIFYNERASNVMELDLLMEKVNPSRNNIQKHHNRSLYIWSIQYWSK